MTAVKTFRSRDRNRGAGLVEFALVAPTLLAMTMAALQYGMVFHAKYSLNYAAFEGARAGALNHASTASIERAMARALTAYFGGGSDLAALAAAAARAQADVASAMRIEILSPTRESFDDFHSADAARRAGTSARTIPSANLPFRSCPPDRPGCSSNPAHNASGQTLADANLLKLRITWGIPPQKQMPLAGRFFVWAVQTLNPSDNDTFRRSLLAAGRIPVVAHATVRMHSDPIENGRMASIPGRGNGGRPTAPVPDGGGATGAEPGADLPSLPGCPAWEPLCVPEAGAGSGAGEGDGGAGDGSTPPDDGSPIC